MVAEIKFSIPGDLQKPNLFLPETTTPKQALLLNQNRTGAIFEVGQDASGEYYFLRSLNEKPNIIILNNNKQRLQLKEPSYHFDYNHLAVKLNNLSEHIYNPGGIDPIHRQSQELVQTFWELISPILESEKGRAIIKPKSYLEVELDNGENKFGGLADAIGITAKGNIIIIEHASNRQLSRAKKYRQVENSADLFMKSFGSSLSIRPICIFHTPLENGDFYLRIGHARSIALQK
ncbi:MAG: hypothetical protein ABH812_00455 [bacterium]